MLGLGPGASVRDVQHARRRLAKTEHPDVGGSAEAMRRINEAVAVALAAMTGPQPSSARSRADARHRHSSSRTERGPVHRDHPSFVVEALPVETFEALRIVASWLGEVIDDDPPYCLEVSLGEPVGVWCRLDLVPDAGASTVSLTAEADEGMPVPDIVAVRDAFIDGLNRLDWSVLHS